VITAGDARKLLTRAAPGEAAPGPADAGRHDTDGEP
jgi:hypothetical protein